MIQVFRLHIPRRTNHSPSGLTDKLQPEIARFGRVLRWVMRLQALFIFVPIDRLLSWFRFSEEFRNGMVYPLTALFFGTGNQTPHVSAAIVANGAMFQRFWAV